MRATLHYIAIIAVFIIYGGQVCPFIASLDIKSWAVTSIFSFALAYIIRIPIINSVIGSSTPYKIVVNSAYTEFAIIFLASLGIGLFNYFYYGFPPGSAFKIIICGIALGFFMACDIALEQERKLNHHLKQTNKEFFPSGKFMTLTGQFSIISTIIVVLMISIVVLIVIRDLEWLARIEPDDISKAKTLIIMELGFVTIVALAEIINLIISYTSNLWLFFEGETSVLHDATGGNLNSRVTISSNNEFGIMGHYTNKMIEKLKEYTDELSRTRDVTILTLATVAEARDSDTGAHIMRTQRYVKILAKYLRKNHIYEDQLDDKTIDLIFKSSSLHDIGKVGIPDHILLKPGKLTDEEFEIMKQHPTIGRDSLKWAERRLGFNSFLHFASEIAYHHHEKWDGSGYPLRLIGEEIPLSARLMALADVYDALISKRVYKEAFTHQKSIDIILEGKGSHFDPAIVDAFMATNEDFIKVSAKFRDDQSGEFEDFDKTLNLNLKFG